MRSFIFCAASLVVALAVVGAGTRVEAKTHTPDAARELKSPSPEPKTIMLWRGEKWMLDYTNWVRARFGAEPVVIDPKLQESCRRHCMWMARNNSMVHSSGSWENIAMGQSSVPHAMNTWEHSSGHFSNMINRSHKTCGMACYQMPNGQRFFCQQFGN